MKKLSSYNFSSIFCEFLKCAKYAPMWFAAQLQGEWAELVCDVSWEAISLGEKRHQRSQRDLERYYFFIDLVITSHISLELANTAWPKLETCVIWHCFGCQPLAYFHSVVVFLQSEVRRCAANQDQPIP